MDSFHLGLEMITPSTPRPVSMHKEGAKTPIPTRRHSPIGALKQESAPSPAQDSVIEPSGQAVLNPDLPTRDVLFVFSNMYSYTRTPKQGAQGVTDEDLRHASRLLDYSRMLQQRKKNRVNNVHIKYRFPDPLGESAGKGTPPPYSVLTDPVIKIDMQHTGAFEPSFAAAVFKHISEKISPPPKYIVVSYVASDLTSQHIKDLALWCTHATPPITLLSITETRIRESRSLADCLGDGIDLPMYLTEHEVHFDDFDNHTPASATSGPAYQPYGRSTTGGSYLRAREKALRAFGVVTNSYSSARGSWRSDHDAGGGVRVLRGATLEALIDSMGLGEGERQIMGDETPDPVKEYDRLGKTRSGTSAGRRSWHTPSGQHNTSWRDLLISQRQNDRFNPEYIDGDM